MVFLIEHLLAYRNTTFLVNKNVGLSHNLMDFLDRKFQNKKQSYLFTYKVCAGIKNKLFQTLFERKIVEKTKIFSKRYRTHSANYIYN